MPEIQEQNVLLTLTTTSPNSQIRYTMDGSIPSIESNLYSSPIEVPYNTTVKSRAFRDGYIPSETSVYTTKPISFTITDDLNENIKTLFNSNYGTIYWSVYLNNSWFMYGQFGGSYKFYKFSDFYNFETWQDCTNVFSILSSFNNISSFTYKEGNYYLLYNTTLYVATEEEINSNSSSSKHYTLSNPSNNAGISSYSSFGSWLTALLLTNNRLLYFHLGSYYESGYVTGRACLKISEININSSNVESIIYDGAPFNSISYAHYTWNWNPSKSFNPIEFHNGVYYSNKLFMAASGNDYTYNYIIYSTDLINWKYIQTSLTRSGATSSNLQNCYINNNYIYVPKQPSFNGNIVEIYYFDWNDSSVKKLKNVNTQNNSDYLNNIYYSEEFIIGKYDYSGLWVSKNLENFNKYFLKDAYTDYMIGNFNQVPNHPNEFIISLGKSNTYQAYKLTFN